MRFDTWWRTIAVLLLALLGVACDPPQGPRVEFHNQTDVHVWLFSDPLFITSADGIRIVEPDEVEPVGLYGSFRPGEARSYHVSDVDRVEPSRPFVLRALLDDGTVVFQRTMTVQEFMIPDLTIDIVDQRLK